MAARQGNGAGWGGPAKGAGSKAPKAPAFEPGNTAAVGNGEAHSIALEVAKSAREVMVAEAVTAARKIITLMNDPKSPPMLQFQAANKVVEIAEGTPIARSVNVNTDDVRNLDDDQLDAKIANLLGKGGLTGRPN